MESINWCEKGIDLLSNVFAGLFLIWVALKLYKRTKKKETLIEAEISIDLRTRFAVNEFKRIQAKHAKPMTKNSISGGLEKMYTELFVKFDEIEKICLEYDLPFDKDLNLLRNHIYSIKSIFYINNLTPIDDEKIGSFIALNKFRAEGMNFNIEDIRESNFSTYLEIKKILDEKIASGNFLKKYY